MPSCMGLWVLQNMACSYPGVTYHYRLFSIAGWPVFLPEPLDNSQKIYGQSYLKTFAFSSKTAHKFDSRESWKSDNQKLDKIQAIGLGIQQIQTKIQKNQAGFSGQKQCATFHKMLDLQPDKLKNQDCCVFSMANRCPGGPRWRGGLAFPSINHWHFINFKGRSHFTDRRQTLSRSLLIASLVFVLYSLVSSTNMKQVFQPIGFASDTAERAMAPRKSPEAPCIIAILSLAATSRLLS